MPLDLLGSVSPELAVAVEKLSHPGRQDGPELGLGSSVRLSPDHGGHRVRLLEVVPARRQKAGRDHAEDTRHVVEQHEHDQCGNDTVGDVVCVIWVRRQDLAHHHPVRQVYSQVKGMHASTMKAGRASPIKSQLILVAFSIIMAPTMTRTDPVAQDGMLLKIGAKKMLTKNQKLVAMAVNPVFPPSAIPLADSVQIAISVRGCC
jgi:hypothetical protein